VTPTRRSSPASDRSRIMNAEVVPPHRPIVARDKLDGGPGPLFLSYWNMDLMRELLIRPCRRRPQLSFAARRGARVPRV
jgi:hypothetical protein